MKDKVLVFIIGLLIGAIIATLGFYFYQKYNTKQETTNTTNQEQMEFPGGEINGKPPARPDGENGEIPTPPDMQNDFSEDGNKMGNPPAKPDGDEMPAQPDSNNTSNL